VVQEGIEERWRKEEVRGGGKKEEGRSKVWGRGDALIQILKKHRRWTKKGDVQ
jgi:hypothetical protein